MKNSTDFARGLITMAEQDILILKKLRDDREIMDAAWGLHAQQAVEKLLKSILAARAVNFPYTHQLFHLQDALQEQGIELPERFFPLLEFTCYAGELRYSPTTVPPAKALDRVTSLTLILELRGLVTTITGL